MIKKDMDRKMIFGVCSGLGKKLDIDPTIIRAVLAIATLMGFGLPIIIYLVLAVLMPQE